MNANFKKSKKNQQGFDQLSQDIHVQNTRWLFELSIYFILLQRSHNANLAMIIQLIIPQNMLGTENHSNLNISFGLFSITMEK